MQLSAPPLTAVQRAATSFRLLMVALASLGVLAGNLPPHPALPILGSGYVVFTALIWVLAPHLAWSWLLYPIVLVDLATVTGLLVLVPASPASLWILYLFPLASAAAVGTVPAAVVAGLVAGYLGLGALTSELTPVAAIWPVIALLVATFLMVSLSTPWVAERQRARVWKEIAVSLRALGGHQNTGTAASTVVETARRLVRAEAAWLWWHEEKGQLRLGPQAGRVSTEPPATAFLAPAVAWKLRRCPVPISAVAGSLTGMSGDVVALRRDGEIIALLAVAWRTVPERAGEVRERLRVLSPSASEALTAEIEAAQSQERLHREEVLRGAATELAATLDRLQVQDILLSAARTGLNAAVSLVERTTGRVLDGDVQVTEALVRLTVDVETMGSAESRPQDVAQGDHEVPLSVMIEERLALIAWRDDPPLDEAEASWLSHLAAAGRGALDRCGAHERLVANEKRLQACLEAMGAPVALWDPGGALLLTNAAFCSLSATVPVPPQGLLPGEIHEQEIQVGDPPRSFVAVSTRTDEGENVVTVYREITREREALRAKDELIAMAGHELRTPLTSIAGYSQMMARQLGVIQQQVGQLNHLIGDFVDASHRDDGQLSLELQQVNVADLVRKSADRFLGSHPQHVLRLSVADAPTIEGDPARLGQVLDNLLGNAAKYSPAGQEIVLSLEARDDQVTLSVRDHGIGIASEHLPLLFERFYRVPGVCEGFKGLGLGLSIVRDLVDAHGGHVWAESAGSGRGSTFWVSIPVAAAEAGRRLKLVASD